jgi:hypothetical protein
LGKRRNRKNSRTNCRAWNGRFFYRKLITSGHLELLRQGIDFDNVKVPKENCQTNRV